MWRRRTRCWPTGSEKKRSVSWSWPGCKRRRMKCSSGKRPFTRHGRTPSWLSLSGGAMDARRLRKRCVVEVEVATGSEEAPRVSRRMAFAVPDQGALEVRLRAAMVEEVDESEVATVVLDPPQQPPVLDPEFEELDFDDYSAKYQLWEQGVMTSEEVRRRFGKDVLDMMEAQYIACKEMDEMEARDRATGVPLTQMDQGSMDVTVEGEVLTGVDGGVLAGDAGGDGPSRVTDGAGIPTVREDDQPASRGSQG
ncbi:unnamed protein product [Symbiodinium sp. CCMP2592]|nr:unnamed protein product [Symbiodinium sp. CCMP2592]